MSSKKVKADKKMTPLMTQYWGIKENHMDKVLLFRMGDFFEMFHDDAKLAAPILEIALTQRNKKSQDDTAMCGVPHHSIAGPINKLLAAGHKIAICDQVEDPKEAKGIVKRAVTRILTPGMVFDPDTLDELTANYICSYDEKSVSFLDSTTGEAFYYLISTEAERETLLQALGPKEVVLPNSLFIVGKEKNPKRYFSEHNSDEVFNPDWPQTSNLLLSYAVSMQGESLLQLITRFQKRERFGKMSLPSTVIKHLEIFENYRGEKEGSLFEAIRRTKTSTGSRLLKRWLQFPLTHLQSIEDRLNEVEFWYNEMSLNQEVRKHLSFVGDVERRLGKISNPGCHPRDLNSLQTSLRAGLQVIESLGKRFPEDLKLLELQAQELVQKISSIIVEEPPVQMKAGGFIQKGFRNDLDELIDLSSNTQKALSELESREKDTTGISSLKIRYNNVFGYYIEVTNTHKDKVPEHYIRKQTLTNAERYVTEELGQLEAKVLSARTRRIEVEIEVFEELKKKVLSLSSDLLRLADYWSEIDVLSSLAWLAMEENYCRPGFLKEQKVELKASRHPVVEQEISHSFIPNDITLEPNGCMLLTGPNMAGKSTIMRQVAIISILAQIGSFVPADSAELPLFENIFTRIGASDFLTEGLSTFMVEMTETAEMLKNSNEKSLVILDEIGRGTSTYDGMSLAQSILEHLVSQSHSLTFFATHYHELTKLSEKFPEIKNSHMRIREKNGEIEFLHTLASGAANRSYGIQVAELAGLPREVIGRANEILKGLESGKNVEKAQGEAESAQLSLLSMVQPTEEDQEKDRLLSELRSMTVHEVTPLEALNKIAQWQQSLS